MALKYTTFSGILIVDTLHSNGSLHIVQAATPGLLTLGSGLHSTARITL